ncbi:MAG: hypothetical protein AAGM45_21250 [Cyanobacteria bacterium J06588_5]
MNAQNSVPSDADQQAIQELIEEMQDPLKVIEDVRIEDEANCTISAGYGQRISAKADRAHSLLKQTRRKQLRILVDGEFYRMLKDCDLGAGLPEASRVGWQILSERLKRPSEDVQQQLMGALEAALALDETQRGIPDSIYLQVRSGLRALLSEQDWEAISSAAITAIQRHFKQQIAEAKAT